MYAQIPALVNSLYAIRSVEAGIPNILGRVSSSGQSAVFENSSGALSSTNSMGTPPTERFWAVESCGNSNF